MHVHAHSHTRFHAAQKSTWISVGVNVLLTVLQIVIGIFGKSQALIADGLHSLSDLLSDFLVLWANRASSRAADATHPYGHARIETAATLALGIALTLLGLALLWGAGIKLQDPAAMGAVHVATLYIALFTLVAKELLYRYLMAVAKRVKSKLLAANAWHSRSDAASSLVVVVGIGGNLLGFHFLDLVAALIVAFLIARMGVKMAWEAMSELIDTGLDEAALATIREAILNTPGVLGLHELRTRRMGNQALVDAHILVDPRISVSEGHYIAEAARRRVLDNAEVLDVMVHIDPEDDAVTTPSAHLPGRDALLAELKARLGDQMPEPERVVLHYLDGKVEAEMYLPAAFCADPGRFDALKAAMNALVAQDGVFRSVHLHRGSH